MLQKLHYLLTRSQMYRVSSRRLIRRFKTLLGLPDPWGEIIRLLNLFPQAIYLDIGAHEGATIERISDECKNTIHGFEPTPESFLRLQRRFQRSTRIHLWNSACSDKTSRARIYLNQNSQTNSLFDNAVGNKMLFPVDTAHTGDVEISTITLDEWIRIAPVPKSCPLIIKCDVQGAELKVIQGALETLQDRCLIFYSEVQLKEMYEGQATFLKVHHTLTKDLGFVLNDIYPCLHDQSGEALQCDVMWSNPVRHASN